MDFFRISSTVILATQFYYYFNKFWNLGPKNLIYAYAFL